MRSNVRSAPTTEKLTRQVKKKIYNKKLYQRNEEWVPDIIDEGNAELAMMKFARALTALAKTKDKPPIEPQTWTVSNKLLLKTSETTN